MSRTDHDVREPRLALVLPGGVSLAIYMFGVTRELHRLVKASALLDQNADAEPSTPSERAYADLLRHLAELDAVRTRVVVDTIAGTSAGGINGIYLAKALAHNRSLDELRDLWLRNAEMAKLLRGPTLLPKWLRIPWLVLTFWRAPLRGKAISRWLFEALERMDARAPEPSTIASLMPRDHPLRLLVTTTDYVGYEQGEGLMGPKVSHKHVVEFRYGTDGADDFGRGANVMLALAARATSSFPVAFPPVSLASFTRDVRARDIDLDRLEATLFPEYRLVARSARDAHFIDGGLLDNRPFGPVLDALRTPPPSTVESYRYLVFVDPDPPGSRPPSTQRVRTDTFRVFGRLAGIVGSEVPDQADELVRRAESTRQVRDTIEAAYDKIEARVRELLGPMDLVSAFDDPSWAETEARAVAAAQADAGFMYTAYLRLRLLRTVDRIAEMLSAACGLPPWHAEARLLRGAVAAWAKLEGVFQREAEVTLQQADFLRLFDVDYARRRLRFTANAISRAYRTVGRPESPTRAQLNELKRRMGELTELLSTEGLEHELRQIVPGKLVEEAKEFRLKHGRNEAPAILARRLSEFMDDVGEAFRRHARNSARETHEALRSGTQSWSGSWREELFVRYFGFPFWDALLYSMEGGEQDTADVQRISPVDTILLPRLWEARKVRGVERHHFGAFFSRADRENDYLWGRLDAAEVLVGLLFRGRGKDRRLCLPALHAILEEEEPGLPHMRKLFVALKAVLGSVPT